MLPRPARTICCLTLLGALSARAELSPEMRAKINADFPSYHPNPPEEKKAETPSGAPAPLSDDPLVILPKFRVEDRRLAGIDPDKLRSEREIQHQAMVEYKDSMTPLEWALNCFFIPILSAPPSVRARAYYEDRKYTEEMKRLEQIEKADPSAH